MRSEFKIRCAGRHHPVPAIVFLPFTAGAVRGNDVVFLLFTCCFRFRRVVIRLLAPMLGLACLLKNSPEVSGVVSR